jgi:hypothetical protein
MSCCRVPTVNDSTVASTDRYFFQAISARGKKCITRTCRLISSRTGHWHANALRCRTRDVGPSKLLRMGREDAVMKAVGRPASRLPCSVPELLLGVTVTQLQEALRSLVVPLGRLIRLNLLLGRSLRTIVLDVVQKLAGAVGWIGSPPRHRLFRGPGGVFTLRRWHYAAGAHHPQPAQAAPL